ncbi:hypothetical protein ACI77M_03620 [Pseudomonas fildesensis]|uniref:hypothetical protein n=1 Tax=Pseudomonas fildesensis TaxID=1674920 RepID=UPI00387B9AD6
MNYPTSVGSITVMETRTTAIREETPLKLHLSILLFSIALCAEVQAAPSPETEAVFEHAMLLANDIQQRVDQLIEKEQQGKIDKLTMSQSIQEATKGLEAFEGELRKASVGGHGVASFVLANLHDGRAATFLDGYEAMHAEACALYQNASDQGLIAGAVIVLRNCDEAFQRQKFDDPELLRKHSQLVNALEQPDPYSDYYPLPARGSYCFKDSQIPEVNHQQPLTTMRDIYQPVSLSLEQFRADGYYLLALTGDIANPKVRAYFKQVQKLAPECLDPSHLQSLFKNMERKSH